MNAVLVETDYAAWAVQQAELLRAGTWDALDIEHIAGELDAIMGNERRELFRRFRVLVAHLLKWQFQPSQRSSGWRGTIRIQCADIDDFLADSPSLRCLIPEKISQAYPIAN